MSYAQLIYCSLRTATTDEAAKQAEVRDIIAVARRVNPRQEITGALLLGQDRYAQVLEGPGEALDRLFDRIRRDARHHDIAVLPAPPVADRMFPDWSMGLTAIPEGDPSGTDSATEVLDQASAVPDEAAAVAVRDLIQRTIATVQLW